jgi:hypothetical protein
MSAMVWVLMLYSAFTVTALTVTQGIPVLLGMIYNLLCFMALSSHAKTSFTDPGSVPIQAIPSERQRLLRDSHSMCGQCQTFKPPGSHHCRICNRCISRMDHHCPWMNNCVGVSNLKHFILFLAYTWMAAGYALALFGWNYFFCASEDCTFHPVILHLVRLMTLLAVGAFLFTSSMLMNVCYGIMTGIGTIDRLKKKASNTMNQSSEEPINLIDVRVCLWFRQIQGAWCGGVCVCETRGILFPIVCFWNAPFSHTRVCVCLGHRCLELGRFIPGRFPATPSLKTTIVSWATQCRNGWIGNGNFVISNGPCRT